MPAYLIYGEEQFLCDQYLKSILPNDPLSISYFDMREQSVLEAISETSQGSLFSSGPKTIILKDCYFLDSEKALPEVEQKTLLETLSSDKENTFIFSVRKIDKRKKLTKELLKIAEKFEGKPNKYPTNWVMERAKKHYQLPLTKSAADKMVTYLGTDLYLLDSELQKIKVRYYHEKIVTDDMLSDILSRTLESNVFKLIELIMLKQKDAFDVLQDLLVTNTEEIQITLLIARQLRIIEQVLIEQKTGNQIMGPNKAISMHPYAITKAKEQAELYSLEEIQRKIEQIAELDLSMKRGLVDKTIALEKFILNWL